MTSDRNNVRRKPHLGSWFHCGGGRCGEQAGLLGSIHVKANHDHGSRGIWTKRNHPVISSVTHFHQLDLRKASRSFQNSAISWGPTIQTQTCNGHFRFPPPSLPLFRARNGILSFMHTRRSSTSELHLSPKPLFLHREPALCLSPQSVDRRPVETLSNGAKMSF